MHLLSPPTLRGEGLSWIFGMGVVVDVWRAVLEVSACSSGCEVFCGDVSVGDTELRVS